MLLLTALMRVALDDGEGLRVFVVLHDEPATQDASTTLVSAGSFVLDDAPAQTLLVFAVHLAGLLELLRQLVDAVGFRMEVDHEGVGGHFAASGLVVGSICSM